MAAVALPSQGTADNGALQEPLPIVRLAVRQLLLSSPGFAKLEPERQRQLASGMVRVCHAAAALIREEVESDRQAHVATAQTEPATPRKYCQSRLPFDLQFE